jgi:hypothetical protein
MGMNTIEDEIEAPLQWNDKSDQATDKFGRQFDHYWFAAEEPDTQHSPLIFSPLVYVIKRRQNAARSTLLIFSHDFVVFKQDFDNTEGAKYRARNWRLKRLDQARRSRFPHEDLGVTQ